MAKMDKLSRDAKDAISMGMSYGKYMSQKQPEIIIPPKPTHRMRECQKCGNQFPLTTRGKGVKKFCSDECREAFYRERIDQMKKEQRKEMEKPEIHKTCPICGKDFVTIDPRRKYCGELCARVASVNRVKKYKKRNKEGLNNGNNQVL